jgi:hypothetical protein
MVYEKELRLPVILQASNCNGRVEPAKNNHDDQELLYRKRQLEIEDQELQQSQKRMMLQIQQAIVQSALCNDFVKVDKLRDCMKTCLTNPSTTTIPDEEDQDVKVILEIPGELNSIPSFSDSSYSTGTAVPIFEGPIEMPLLIEQPFNNRPHQFLVHVVASNSLISVDKHTNLEVVYREKKHCAENKEVGHDFCELCCPHYHYILYFKTQVPIKRSSYLIRLHKILRKEISANLVVKEEIIDSDDEMCFILNKLHEMPSL